MTNKTLILLVDDQPHNLDVLVNYLGESYLAREGLELMVATSGAEALDIACQRPPSLVLLDVMMPDMDGFEVCRRLQDGIVTKEVPVIFMSALTDTDSKVKGFAAGAVDFVSKPIQREEVLARINAHLTLARQQQELLEKNRQLERLNAELQEQIDRRLRAESAYQLADQTLSSLTRQEAQTWGIDAFVGQSPAIIQLLDEVRSLQQAPRTNVLVLGESGTGKELIARAIHYGSARRGKAFIAVNCAAIPAELADAEFFGHTKGAFTGATSDRHGFFEQADGGTLFLDEIGDMPLPLQAKLLRVLEDGLVTPVGGKYSRKVDVRVVAATNVDMRNRIQQQEFRQDLYFRLAGYSISLPPLRERINDVPILAAHFLAQLGGQMGRDKPAIASEALLQLNQYHYPGNVRELKNLIEYALIASRGQMIQAHHLHFLEPLQKSPELAATPSAATGATSNSFPRTNTDSEEQQLLDFAHTKGRIDNMLAQELLRIDHGRASYLLKKLHREGHLYKQGERRWTYYTATE